eukprot:maker-scaffold13_size735724-snap-gene-1.14 protein:Tk03453 transcript:maker-scaffold13_size735724-snap-gene-1.14-mRNA-1 annotation:"calcium uptake protein mitochondrial isoform x2"
MLPNPARQFFLKSLLTVQKIQGRFSRPVASFSKDTKGFLQYPEGKVVLFALATGVSGTTLLYFLSNNAEGKSLIHKATGHLSNDPTVKRKLTAREKRFIKFASVEYDGQIYMTPQDFLESVVEGEPRPRFKRKSLSGSEVEALVGKVPRINKNNEQFFRSLGNRGIISFSEYLFLLTILIKPQSGFKIAFAMLDQDGNEMIDKTEFRLLETVFSSAAKERKQVNLELRKEDEDSGAQALKDAESSSKVAFDDEEHGLQRAHSVDTTLLVYFFGRRGNDQLKFDDFHRFMENLQTEVLQMEYQEFSKGAKTISELDFARILLRYTFLNSEEYENILDRLVDRLENETGITFEEFKDFCLFLNNLDDFQIAMRMYTLADKAISEDEFSRAVTICTGRKLSEHLVHIVFQIFDNDGDELLTYQEFIAMMKDRVNRGLKTFSRQEGWTGFKRCVKQEVRQGSS